MMLEKLKKLPNKGLLLVIAIALLVSAGLIIRNYTVGIDFSRSQASGESAELKEIKSKIKEKKAKWEAGETSASKLNQEERKKLVMADADFSLPSGIEELEVVGATAPATLDWRNIDGANYVTPIKNQGGCGSCWAFATVATGESALLLKNKTPFSQNPLDLSEQILVSCSGAGSCDGGSPTAASSYFQSTGLPAESCYPYTGSNGTCSTACANWQATAQKIDNYQYIGGDINTLKNALFTYGPLIGTMSVYSDFYSYRTGIYSYVTGSYVGGHAITIIGYDDTNQCFIGKNSWGTGWGEAGYFRIAYSQIPSIMSSRMYAHNTITPVNPPEPDTQIPTVSLTSPSGGATLAKTVTISANASDNVGVTRVEFLINGDAIASDTSSPYAYGWNTLLVSNGAYSVQAKAYDAAGNTATSSQVNVTVSNVPDAAPPTVVISNPADNFQLPPKGIVQVVAQAQDDVAVTKVEIYLDKKIKASCAASACTYNLNSATVKKGPHTITAKAYDAAGHTASAMINVTK